MTKPIRIQRKRTKGYKMTGDNGLPTVYVGRGSRWGNPFRVVKHPNGRWSIKTDGSKECNDIMVRLCHFEYDTKEEATMDAIKCYDFWLLPYKHGDSLSAFYQSMAELESLLFELKGKNLACWCNLKDKCHADLLLKIANSHTL
jgi:hypothetical protein